MIMAFIIIASFRCHKKAILVGHIAKFGFRIPGIAGSLIIGTHSFQFFTGEQGLEQTERVTGRNTVLIRKTLEISSIVHHKRAFDCFPIPENEIGIPSSFVRSVAREASPYITSDMVVVNTGKGLEEGSMELLSEVLTEEIPQAAIVVLTGPSHAEEVGRCISTAVVAASKSAAAAAYVQETLSNQCFRIYENDDIVGCELGGALKNIIALCAGICDGLGYGDNTKAALMTRGIHEIARLGVAMGARAATFSGLAGIGDLIVTCTSMHSRNRRAGILIGEGIKPEDAVKQVGTVEGYFCCHVAYKLAQQMGVDMPITEQLYHVLFEGSDVRDALGKLMSRPSRHENEECSYLRDMMN